MRYFRLVTILYSALFFLSALGASIPSQEKRVVDSEVSLGKRHDKKGYYCSKSKLTGRRKFYKQKAIDEASKKACDRMGGFTYLNWSFPASFSATKYKKQGPCVEWPIGYSGPLSLKPTSSDRIILNRECEVVDVVMKRKDGGYQQCDSHL